MKRFISWMLIGIAALGLSLGAMAGVSDTGAYLGVAQTFAGSTDSYIGYTFGNVIQTSAFSVQFNVDGIFKDSAFLINSGYGFDLSYEYDVDALDFEVYVNTLFLDTMNGFAKVDTGARAEFLVLPNPCKEVGPCYNPELKIFAEVGVKQITAPNSSGILIYGVPTIWGEVGFEIHL